MSPFSDSPAEVTTPETFARHPARIFVVEDEALIAMELSDRLAHLGFTPIGQAARGEDAIETIKAERPDLVLMDINLAGTLNGLETAERLRDIIDLPVVFLTAYSDSNLIQRALRTEAYGYLIKPYREREMGLAIEFALHRHASQRQLRELNEQLQHALTEVKQLQGLLPICGHCKKIRDEEETWHGLEEFIATRAEVSFTHSFCPECFQAEMNSLQQEMVPPVGV